MENINEKDLEFRKVFAKRLRMLRKEKGLTLKELEKILLERYELKQSYGNLANYERGYRSPYLFALNAFADLYDVSIDWILGRTDERKAKVIQSTLFDKENNSHIVKVGIDKDSDLANRPFSEIIELVEKLKELGFSLERNPQNNKK